MLDPGTLDNRYHVTICIPSHETIPWQFANALANMIGYTIHEVGDKVKLSTIWCIGTYVQRARQTLIENVMEGEGTHYILWLDSDHNFPMDLLVRLLAHDVGIVGVNYSTRKVPFRFVGVKRLKCDNPDDPALLRTTEESTGLETCEALGFGALLMKASILGSLPSPEKGSWFKIGEVNGVEVGEDVYFSRLVREAGWDLYCDHDLSKEITHVGQMEYKLDHVWAMEEEGYHVDYDIQRVADDDREVAGEVGSDG